MQVVPGEPSLCDLGTDANAWKDLHIDGEIIPLGTAGSVGEVLALKSGGGMEWKTFSITTEYTSGTSHTLNSNTKWFIYVLFCMLIIGAYSR